MHAVELQGASPGAGGDEWATPAVAEEDAGLRRPRRPVDDPGLLARQTEEYAADRAKGVIELQRYRRTHSIPVADRDRRGMATLVNLNPRVNEWYLLELAWNGQPPAWYHLVNRLPGQMDLELRADYALGLVRASEGRNRPCALWNGQAAGGGIEELSRQLTPFVVLCDGEVLLRRRFAGARTSREWAADFLRDKVWGGEKLTVLARKTLYGDAFLETAQLRDDPGCVAPTDEPGRPSMVRVEPGSADCVLRPPELGIAVEGDGSMVVGRWYAARAAPGVFVSVVEPGVVAPVVPPAAATRLKPLDEVERRALAYLIAFDLDRLELGFSLGTDHPRVGWSPRAPAAMRDERLPGPDGIGDIAPLVASGALTPRLRPRVVATFTGGFKRQHGAFRKGALSQVNAASHYGFVESGVVLSKLQPGLATLAVRDDGSVEMKTWTREDDVRLERVRFARQNGVPIVEPEDGAAVPGSLVSSWGAGNWSGSQGGSLRTLRAGACLLAGPSGRFLVYGYFSSGTPSAMARVFLAAGCDYAMLLDMNALEHTYLALYELKDRSLEVQHLIRGMDVLDSKVDGALLPRFLGYADNRDFFYVLRREPRAAIPGDSS